MKYRKSADLILSVIDCFVSLQRFKLLMIMKYLERVADQMLKDRLEAFGAVLIERRTTTSNR